MKTFRHFFTIKAVLMSCIKLKRLKMRNTAGLETHTNSNENITFTEANSCSLEQEIRLIIWKPKVHYRFHKSSLLIPFQNTSALNLFKIRFNIILPSTLRYSMCPLSCIQKLKLH